MLLVPNIEQAWFMFNSKFNSYADIIHEYLYLCALYVCIEFHNDTYIVSSSYL